MMIERNLKTMIWMVGFFLMVGCSAGSKVVRKDREPREENSLRQQNIGLKNGDLSQPFQFVEILTYEFRGIR